MNMSATLRKNSTLNFVSSTLEKCGLGGHNFSTNLLRPVIEHVSVVYGPLLNESSSREIENLQRTALRTIYGNKLSYRKMLALSDMDTLEDRRRNALKRFAKKSQKNERFSTRWFVENKNDRKETLRNRERFVIRRSKFDRLLIL